MIDLNNFEIHRNSFGQLFMELTPEEIIVIHLDLDEKTIQERREDLKSDNTLKLRRKLYDKLSKDLNIPTIMNDKSIDEVHYKICEAIKEKQ
jgi:thymidylate kinase